jgi:hypothetical protein
VSQKVGKIVRTPPASVKIVRNTSSDVSPAPQSKEKSNDQFSYGGSNRPFSYGGSNRPFSYGGSNRPFGD